MTNPSILFAKAQARVFESILKPLGYAKGKQLYVRHAHPQLHGIEFQDDERTPGEYYVNLGISFDFLPAFMQADVADIPTAEYHMVDFLFTSRIGRFLPGPYVESWDFWELDAAGIEALVRKNVTDCLRVFERYGREWEERRILELFPPELIKLDHDRETERYEAEQRKIPWQGTLPLTELIGKDWQWQHHNIAYTCGIIAGRSQKRDLARRHMAVAREIFPEMADGGHAKLRRRAGLAADDGQPPSARNCDVPEGYVRFTSCLGTSFVAPSAWTEEQEDDVFTLHAPDGHGVINAFRFDGSAAWDVEWFKHTMVAGVVKRSRKWKPIETSEVTIGPYKAVRQDFFPKPEQKVRWRLYTYTTASFYYAIILEATNEAMSVNGESYEKIIRTFDDGE